MKVILLLQRNVWFIEHELAWYRLSDNGMINQALAVLPLTTVDEYTQLEQPHLAGEARIECAGGLSLTVKLQDPGGREIQRQEIELDRNRLMRVDWLTRPYRDGWVDASARLQMEGVRMLEVQAYLPAAGSSTGKVLRITDERTGEHREVFLTRNQTTVVPFQQDGARCIMRLECQPETVEGSTDSRQLGFVLVGESAQVC